MIEHRLTMRLASYWNLLRKENSMPEFAALNPSAISDIWQYCILFSVQPESESGLISLRFQKIGEKLYPLYPPTIMGKELSASQRHFPGAAVVRRTKEIIADPKMLYDEGNFVNDHSKIVKFRSCVTPFATQGRVSHILICLSWREY